MESLEPWERDLIADVRPYTLTSPQRLIATKDAVEYVVRRGIPGAFVECGVWRGGSVMAMLMTLKRLGVADREVFLFDTFEGMTVPSGRDTSRFDRPALETWATAANAGRRAWDYWFNNDIFTVDRVRENLTSVGYPATRLHLVVGPVEDTVPTAAPDVIGLLRLDTDWYESTKHEMRHLYPRLSTGGTLLIDDYGHWDGCRKAVDEYFMDAGRRPLLHRTDYAGRTAVKP